MSTTRWIKEVALVGLAAALVTSGAACSKGKKEETAKPPQASTAPKLSDAAKAANQLAGEAEQQARQQVEGAAQGGHKRERGGDDAAVPLEVRKQRFVTRTTKRIDALTKRIPDVDAKVKGLDEALVKKWGEIKPDLDAKLAAAKKDFEVYLAAPTDEAFAQARTKIRRALGSIEDALAAAESLGAAAKNAGAAPAPAAATPAGKAG